MRNEVILFIKVEIWPLEYNILYFKYNLKQNKFNYILNSKNIKILISSYNREDDWSDPTKSY